MSAYIICRITAGFAGLIYDGRTDAASPLAGAGMELDAITAVIIGFDDHGGRSIGRNYLANEIETYVSQNASGGSVPEFRLCRGARC